MNAKLLPIDAEDLVSLDRVAELFGRSKKAVYHLVQRGKLRCHKFGGRLYCLRPELNEDLAAMHEVVCDIKQEAV